MSKYTPGPWVQFCDEGRTLAIMPAGRPGDICKFTSKSYPTNANAQLIASAPDLLCAAKQGEELRLWICDAISKAIYEQEERENPDAWKALADAMYDGMLASYSDAFAPAIAKAEGKVARGVLVIEEYK